MQEQETSEEEEPSEEEEEEEKEAEPAELPIVLQRSTQQRIWVVK